MSTNRFILVLGVLGTLCAVVCAELEITRIEVDEQNLATPGESVPSSLKLAASSEVLRIQFTEKEAASRLRYKLEGRDETWQDLTENKAVRVAVQFLNSAGQMIRQRHYYDSGTTPGWKGSVDRSLFHSRKLEVTAPDDARFMRLTFAAGHGMPTTAIIGIDACQVTVRDPNDGSKIVHDWSLLPDATEENPRTEMGKWISRGTRSSFAKVRDRQDPEPHRVLVLEDTHPDFNAHWVMDPPKAIPVKPGSLCLIEWETAFSAGSCGPGVAEYQALEPGRYLFRLSAAEANGQLTGEGLSIPIEITPPLYQRSSFWLVIALFGIGATAIVSRWVIRRRARHHLAEIEQQQALEQERSRIARDLHDQIGANLARIGMLAELADRSLGDSEKARLQLEKVYETARDVTKQLDAVVWAVDPAQDSLESFGRYMHGHAEEYLGLAGIRCHFANEEELPPLVLVSRIRHHLLMIAKEALHNVVSHAAARVVVIRLQLDGRMLVMEIEDDGGGIPAEAGLVPGDGLANMRSRAEALGGSIAISQGKDGTGTLIRLSVPI